MLLSEPNRNVPVTANRQALTRSTLANALLPKNDGSQVGSCPPVLHGVITDVLQYDITDYYSMEFRHGDESVACRVFKAHSVAGSTYIFWSYEVFHNTHLLMFPFVVFSVGAKTL